MREGEFPSTNICYRLSAIAKGVVDRHSDDAKGFDDMPGGCGGPGRRILLRGRRIPLRR